MLGKKITITENGNKYALEIQSELRQKITIARDKFAYYIKQDSLYLQQISPVLLGYANYELRILFGDDAYHQRLFLI